jgi:hypothetical protein
LTGKVKKNPKTVRALTSDLQQCLHESTWSYTTPNPEKAALYKLYESYTARLNTIKSGDIILFDSYPGHSVIKNVMRNFSKSVTGTKYTHVGIVIMMEGLVDSKRQKHPYIIEATTNPACTTDAIDGFGDRRNGLWCFSLPERIASDPAQFWHLPLKTALTPKQEETLVQWAGECYERDPLFDKEAMFGAGFDLLDMAAQENKKDDFAMFFCSEFVSSCFKKLDLLKESVNCSEMTPADVSTLDLFLDHKEGLFRLKGPNEYHESMEHKSEMEKQEHQRELERMKKTNSPRSQSAVDQKSEAKVSGVDATVVAEPDSAAAPATQASTPEAAPATPAAPAAIPNTNVPNTDNSGALPGVPVNDSQADNTTPLPGEM